MTEPEPLIQDDPLRQKLDQQALVYEETTEQLVTGAFAAAVTAATAAFLGGWIAANSYGFATGLLERLRQLGERLFNIPTDLETPLHHRAIEGVRLGAVQARWVMAGGGRPPSARVPEAGVLADGDLVDLIGTMDQRAQARLAYARQLARTAKLDTLASAAVVTNTAQAAVEGAKRDARWAATRALSEGVARVAEAEGWRLIWVPERTACLACLAYAGRTVEPGQLFPADLTFGDAPIHLPPVPYPPRHPHCRCRVEPYDGPDASADRSAQDIASVLRREAERSVARGLSDYASGPAKVRAADRLLRAGSVLPPTVIARARRSVRRRKFPARPTGI